MTDDLDDQCRFEADDLVDHFHFGALISNPDTKRNRAKQYLVENRVKDRFLKVVPLKIAI